MKFDIVLVQKPADLEGLTKTEIIDMLDIINANEVFPIEIDANKQNCVAIGFTTAKFYDNCVTTKQINAFKNFIAEILDDTNNESDDNTYKYVASQDALTIYLGYNVPKSNNK